jgi:peroxiredoxin
MAISIGRTSKAHRTATLAVGDKAPDFSLPTHSDPKKKWSLKEHRGHNVVIAFYPFAFTPV